MQPASRRKLLAEPELLIGNHHRGNGGGDQENRWRLNNDFQKFSAFYHFWTWTQQRGPVSQISRVSWPPWHSFRAIHPLLGLLASWAAPPAFSHLTRAYLAGLWFSPDWKNKVTKVSDPLTQELFFNFCLPCVSLTAASSWAEGILKSHSLFLPSKYFKCGPRWNGIFFFLPPYQWPSFSHKLSFRKLNKGRRFPLLLLDRFMAKTLPKASCDYEMPFELKIFLHFPLSSWSDCYCQCNCFLDTSTKDIWAFFNTLLNEPFQQMP